MANLLKISANMLESNSDVKAYIYQLIQDFEPYVTEESSIIVLAKDATKIGPKLEAEGVEFDLKDLKNKHRIAIVIKESGTKIEAEGIHEDIYEAINIAKDTLLKQLWAIHDTVVSTSERNSMIDQYIQNQQLH